MIRCFSPFLGHINRFYTTNTKAIISQCISHLLLVQLLSDQHQQQSSSPPWVLRPNTSADYLTWLGLNWVRLLHDGWVCTSSKDASLLWSCTSNTLALSSYLNLGPFYRCCTRGMYLWPITSPLSKLSPLPLITLTVMHSTLMLTYTSVINSIYIQQHYR